MSGISGVVFDLDVTLAKTEGLNFGDRTPATLLAPAEPSPTSTPWRTSGVGLPGKLLARGYRVAVITRSRPAYAWTLAWLLRLDFEHLLAGSSQVARTPAEKLRYLAATWNLLPSQILYIGDDYDDREQARIAGCHYSPPGGATRAKPVRHCRASEAPSRPRCSPCRTARNPTRRS